MIMPATLTKALFGLEAELEVEMTLPRVASIWWLLSYMALSGAGTGGGQVEGLAPDTVLGDPHPEP